MVGVAVNDTEEPAHAGLLPAVIAVETEGVTFEFTVMVIPVLVAVVVVTQDALEVITQVTI